MLDIDRQRSRLAGGKLGLEQIQAFLEGSDEHGFRERDRQQVYTVG